MEAEVILNEIQSYDDSPSELIFDRAEELLFPKHAIGRNILGSEESLARFDTDMLTRFLKDNYATDEMVISFIGNIPFESIKKAGEKYFGEIPQKSRKRKRIKPETVSSKKVNEKRDTFQKHVMLLGEAYTLTDPRRLQLYLLNNILGGPGMNSRLNMALRERRGYSYSAESHYSPYTDTGLLMIYFSCDPDRFQDSMQVTRDEISKIRTRLIPERRLINARKQLIGQLAISQENNEHMMLTAAKRLLVFNQIDNLETIHKKLEEITAVQLRESANEILNLKNLNLLIFE